MTDAPTCLVEPTITVKQPEGKAITFIPNATDQRSIIEAINAIRRVLQYILNELAKNNKDKSTKVGKYSEVSRKTQKVRVYNPQDSTQYVDVEQITSLTMKDNKTNETWTWTR